MEALRDPRFDEWALGSFSAAYMKGYLVFYWGSRAHFRVDVPEPDHVEIDGPRATVNLSDGRVLLVNLMEENWAEATPGGG